MPPMARYSSWREKQNAFIHACYVRHEHDECLRVIEEQLSECAFCEYPLYVKGERRSMQNLPLKRSAPPHPASPRPRLVHTTRQP